VADPLVLAVVAFVGGAIGAAIGGLSAFGLAGVVIIAGEAANAMSGAVPPDATTTATAANGTGLTAAIGLGPALGPHVAFGGGVAAAAYAARKGYMETGFDYHEAKNVGHPLGTRPDVLAVGGAFGVLGYLVAHVSATLALPWDPIAIAIVLSAVAHRVALGYPLLGDIGDDVLDMTPFERGYRRQPVTEGSTRERIDGGVEPVRNPVDDPRFIVDPDERPVTPRYVVEPWLPHQYEWPTVAAVGTAVGIFGAFVAYATGSPFLAFGITAALLVLPALGMERIPVTYHMAYPASIVVVGLAGGTTDSGAIAAAVSLPVALVVGAVFGLLSGVAGELAQRILYAHADTHLDPPAVAIVLTTFLIAVLDIVGLLTQSVVPTLGL
jgi:hypothetical protein